MFCGYSTVVFRVSFLGGVFRPSVSGKASFCLLFKLYIYVWKS